MTSLNRSDDNDLLVALRHPLRRRILRRMAGEEAISPQELSADLDKPLSNVSYHVRVLADCAAITLVAVKPVRGAEKHFYCSAVEAPWAQRILDLEEEAAGERPSDPGA